MGAFFQKRKTRWTMLGGSNNVGRAVGHPVAPTESFASNRLRSRAARLGYPFLHALSQALLAFEKHPVDEVPAWGPLFKSEERLGKPMQKGGAKAGGKPFQSIPRKAFCWDHRVALRPPYVIAPAKHRPPSFSLLKKDPHAGTCAIFIELKCYKKKKCSKQESLVSVI